METHFLCEIEKTYLLLAGGVSDWDFRNTESIIFDESSNMNRQSSFKGGLLVYIGFFLFFQKKIIPAGFFPSETPGKDEKYSFCVEFHELFEFRIPNQKS